MVMALLQRALDLLGIESTSGTIRVGDVAPDFTLQDSEGNTVSLQAALASGPVLLAFFPAAFTSGCTQELRTYGGRYDQLIERGAKLRLLGHDDAAFIMAHGWNLDGGRLVSLGLAGRKSQS